MSNGSRQMGLMKVWTIAILVGTGWSTASVAIAAVPVESLLPAEAVIYTRIDGSDGHVEAFEKTAAYKALCESGLSDVITQSLESLDGNPKAEGLSSAITHVMEHGFSAALAVDGPDPGPLAIWGTIVVPEAGEGVDLLENLINALEDDKIKIRDTKIAGRAVKYIEVPNAPVDLGWWAEDDHLVIAFGMNGIASTMAVAQEKRSNITQNPLFKRYSDVSPEFEITQTFWFDIKTLREMFGDIPLPVNEGEDPIPLQAFIDTLGLETLEHFAVLSGFRDEAIWTETVIEAPGERKGLMALLDQPSFKIDQVPAVPLHHLGVAITSFNWGPSTEIILDVTRNMASLIHELKPEKIDEALASFEKKVGFAPQEFFSALGSLNCLYADGGQGVFGLGSVALVDVNDGPKLVHCIKSVLKVISKEVNRPGHIEFTVKQTEKNDATRFQIQLTKFPVIQPTISIDEDWLIFGLVPQAVEAQRRRMAGELFSWSMEDDIGDALALLPEEITSITIVDPTASYKTMIGFAPSFLGLLELGLREDGKLRPDQKFPLDLSDLPPAELVTEPLFLNVAVSTVDDHGVQTYSRQSLPAVPMFGVTTTAAASVAATSTAALTLQKYAEVPAPTRSEVQLARLADAVRQYADAHKGELPAASLPHRHLPVDQRLSWLVTLLPDLQQEALASQIQMKSGWQAPENAGPLANVVAPFLNPRQIPMPSTGYGVTQYVGLGGIGADAPGLAVSHQRAGVFGHDRLTRLQDIVDGLSMTLMISEACDHIGPWGAGGLATVRPLTQQPYLNGPDGLGSSSNAGCQMVLVDGGVREIAIIIDPAVLEALTTIAGHEAVPSF